jgi:2-hydroxychromene-2-carboxylate isomerase
MRRGDRVYFSLRSPYSWIALKLLRQSIPDAFASLELVPFWDPDAATAQALAERGAAFHYTAMSKAKHLYLLHDVKRLAVRTGLSLKWPIDVNPRWELPHLGWLVARDHRAHERFYDLLVDARWGRGANICEPEVLERIARDCGLDPGEVLAAADDSARRAEGADCLAQAWHDDVFGVPYFFAGRQRFWGVDRLDDFLAALGAPPALHDSEAPGCGPEDDIPAAALALVGGFDTDAAGGCG